MNEPAAFKSVLTHPTLPELELRPENDKTDDCKKYFVALRERTSHDHIAAAPLAAQTCTAGSTHS